MFGLDGRYDSAHSPRAELLALLADELPGQMVTKMLPPDACEVVLAALQEANENMCSIRKQFEQPLASGMHWFELSI